MRYSLEERHLSDFWYSTNTLTVHTLEAQPFIPAGSHERRAVFGAVDFIGSKRVRRAGDTCPTNDVLCYYPYE